MRIFNKKGQHMKIKLIVVGKVKEEYYRNKIEYYAKSIRKKHSIDIVEIPDESIPKNPSESVLESIKEKEGEKILGYIQNGDYVVALCIEGKTTGTDYIRELCDKAISKGGSLVYVIGGSLGLSKRVVSRADYKMSFSKMTFPHQLMRVMLLEQIDANV